LLKNSNGSNSKVRGTYFALQFFFDNVLYEKFNCEILLAKKEHKLPVVLSKEEVKRLLNVIEKQRKQILYPPVVAAHISRDLGDLVAPHIRDHQEIEVYFSFQPNSRPHLGTLTTISSAFALAYHLKARFGLDSKVTFEALDNAPVMKREVNGFTYFKPMCFIDAGEGTLAEQNLESFDHFMKGIQQRSNVPYSIKRYSEMQKSPEYRGKLLDILDHEGELSTFLNPIEKSIKLRPICPSCSYGEKSGKLTQIIRKGKGLELGNDCFDHGNYTVDIGFDGKNFVDLNTPVRSVIRKVLLMDESKKGNSLKIMVDGSDWIGMSQQLLPCLGILGYSIQDLPVRFFNPLIEDWAGSKFSKSAYVKSGTYEGIHPALCDYREFKNSLGKEGLDLIWDETLEWVLDSKKFFRNYTIDYFTQRWNLDSRD